MLEMVDVQGDKAQATSCEINTAIGRESLCVQVHQRRGLKDHRFLALNLVSLEENRNSYPKSQLEQCRRFLLRDQGNSNVDGLTKSILGEKGPDLGGFRETLNRNC